MQRALLEVAGVVVEDEREAAAHAGRAGDLGERLRA